MKKKIIALLMVFLILFTNYAFAYTAVDSFEFDYKIDNTKSKLNTIATLLNKNTKIDVDATAKMNLTSPDFNDDYSSSTGTVYVCDNMRNLGTEGPFKGYYVKSVDENTGYIEKYATIKLNKEKKKIKLTNDEFYIIYKDAVSYNGQKYSMKIQINSIAYDFSNVTDDPEIYFHTGTYKKDGNNKNPIIFYPGVGASESNSSDGNNGVELDITTTILDQSNHEITNGVSGLFGVDDIDLNQGLVFEDTDLNNENVFLLPKTNNATDLTDEIRYYKKEKEDDKIDTYVYASSNAIDDESGNIYVLMKNKNRIDMTFTFKTIGAMSNFGFFDNRATNYYKVETNVINGTITESDYEINSGENKRIIYAPKDDTYYLKKIKIDGVAQTITDNIKNSYTFSNINSNHTIEVEYAKKVTVQFNSKGGTSVPAQTLVPGNKAFEPAQPTRDGYTFKGWYVDETYTTPYNFNNPVNEDKILYAKWEEVKPVEVTHNIRYEILGTPKTNNVTTNPTSYKEGTTTPLTIKDPTLEGYTFSGWYENTDLTGNPITTLSVANRKDDITLYGKWTKIPEPEPEPEPVKTAQYRVNHYLEDKNGTKQYNGKTYKLDENNSTTKTGTVGETVSETARTYAGYNKQKDSVQAVVLADGSTTLDLYYDKINYTIVFDSKGGTEVDNQTKNYEEKVDEPEDPTKDGYKFLYWYEEKDGKKVIYDFDTPVTADKNLIAEWEEIKIIPDNPQEEPKKEETVPTQKTDTTVAKKIIPNTGVGTAIFGAIIAIICAFFGIRYFKLRKDMK